DSISPPRQTTTASRSNRSGRIAVHPKNTNVVRREFLSTLDSIATSYPLRPRKETQPCTATSDKLVTSLVGQACSSSYHHLPTRKRVESDLRPDTCRSLVGIWR